MSKKKIGLIFGGISSEHIISIRSSYYIYKTIDRNIYQVLPIYITPNGEWIIPTKYEAIFPDPKDNNETEFLNLFKKRTKKEFFPKQKSINFSTIIKNFCFS